MKYINKKNIYVSLRVIFWFLPNLQILEGDINVLFSLVYHLSIHISISIYLSISISVCVLYVYTNIRDSDIYIDYYIYIYLYVYIYVYNWYIPYVYDIYVFKHKYILYTIKYFIQWNGMARQQRGLTCILSNFMNWFPNDFLDNILLIHRKFI